MFSSKPIRIFVTIFLFVSLFSACRWWKNLSENTNSAPVPFAVQQIPDDTPLDSIEPANYQAEIFLTIFSGNEQIVKKIFVAKNGTQYFITFDAAEKSAVSSLKTAEGFGYLISPAQKIYTENSAAADAAQPAENDIREFISTEWLNEKPSVSFEKVGAENDTSVFKAAFEGAHNSEILVYFDENLKIPRKQEFYTVADEEKTLAFVSEIKNFRQTADEKYFRIPADYKKVSREEFDKIVQQGNKNG